MPAESHPSRHSAWLFLGLAAGFLLLLYVVLPIPFAWLGMKAGVSESVFSVVFAPQEFLASHWHPYSRWIDVQASWFTWE